jgi:hypothetical protein
MRLSASEKLEIVRPLDAIFFVLPSRNRAFDSYSIYLPCVMRGFEIRRHVARW